MLREVFWYLHKVTARTFDGKSFGTLVRLAYEIIEMELCPTIDLTEIGATTSAPAASIATHINHNISGIKIAC